MACGLSYVVFRFEANLGGFLFGVNYFFGRCSNCPRTIQLLLGHTHLEDTTVYLHLSQQQLHTAINPLDQVTIRSYRESRPGTGSDQP
jgi:hypothetical protein